MNLQYNTSMLSAILLLSPLGKRHGRLFKQTWIPSIWDALNQICLKIFKPCNFSIFLLSSLRNGHGPSFKHFNPLHQRIHCAKFPWNWPSGFWEDQNMESVQQHQQQPTDKSDQKFWFRWINNTSWDHHLNLHFFSHSDDHSRQIKVLKKYRSQCSIAYPVFQFWIGCTFITDSITFGSTSVIVLVAAWDSTRRFEVFSWNKKKLELSFL